MRWWRPSEVKWLTLSGPLVRSGGVLKSWRSLRHSSECKFPSILSVPRLPRLGLFFLALTEIKWPLPSRCGRIVTHQRPRGRGRQEETLRKRMMGLVGAANNTSTASMSCVPLGCGLHEFSQAIRTPALSADTVITDAAREVGWPGHWSSDVDSHPFVIPRKPRLNHRYVH